MTSGPIRIISRRPAVIWLFFVPSTVTYNKCSGNCFVTRTFTKPGVIWKIFMNTDQRNNNPRLPWGNNYVNYLLFMHFCNKVSCLLNKGGGRKLMMISSWNLRIRCDASRCDVWIVVRWSWIRCGRDWPSTGGARTVDGQWSTSTGHVRHPRPFPW